MAKKPKVLLLGDSIRMSYQPLVAEALAQEADVVGPGENGQFSLHTLGRLPGWLGELGTPDIVHWNNGVHDCGYNPARTPVQIPLDVYAMTLTYILAQLRDTGATVLWATTTPVHPDRPFVDDTWSWHSEDVDTYNAAAMEVMQAADVPVNDLHAVIAADIDRFLSEDMLHLSDAGRHACRDAVVETVRGPLGQ